LREHGYSTTSMSVCPPNLWNMGWMHYAYGFQSRHHYVDFRVGREDPMKIDDQRFFTRVRELLRNQPRPFFAHLLTISSHSPFTSIPPDQRTLPLGKLQGTIFGDYLQSVHFVDNAIGEFLEALKTDGLAKNTVVFIYGDHEALPVDERQRARPFETDRIGLRLDEHLRQRVPLFVIVPGLHSTGAVERVAGQIDLPPTVLHLLGISDP
jgi:lipoteichoic acid synthase